MPHRDSSAARAPLTAVLEEWLRQHAGSRTVERGSRYAGQGAVHGMVEDGGRVAAKVTGTDLYRVCLWAEGGKVGYSCTCPVGADLVLCKHCVAVALVWLGRVDGVEAVAGAPLTMEGLREHLRGRSRDELVELLVEQALEDDRLRQRLLVQAASSKQGGSRAVALRAAINEAIRAGGYVDYWGSHGYASGVHDVVDSLEALLQDGEAETVADLVEHAARQLNEAAGYVDDSDGSLREVMTRLTELHLAACEQARLDPTELARRLFSLEMAEGDLDDFLGTLPAYAELLGQEGLAAYRELLDAEWSRVPPLRPGDDSHSRYEHQRFRVTSMMERLAALDGDVEALVEVYRRDLSGPYNFLRIADAYRDAGRHDAALDWAERGFAAFAEPGDPRLRDFLAEEYQRRDRHEDAIALMWQEFTRLPCLGAFQKLKTHAEPAGQWPAWRERGLALLRTPAEQVPQPWSRLADHSELVRVLLWEGELETAWVEAQAGGCSQELWLELAARREAGHPDDALPVYQRAAEQALRSTGNRAYEEAVRHLRTVRALLHRLGRAEEFADHVQSLRQAHRRKRNLMKLLDVEGW